MLMLLLIVNLQGQTQRSAKDYFDSGISHLQQGDADRAISDLDKAIELNPKFPEAYFIRAGIQFLKGDFDPALADYNKVIELVPNAPGIERLYNNRGVIRRLKGDKDGAFADFSKAISINPQYAEAYNGRGEGRADKGDMKGAISDYNKSLELKPNQTAVYINRGSPIFKWGIWRGLYPISIRRSISTLMLIKHILVAA